MPFLKSLPEDAGPPHLFKRYPQIYRPWAEMSEALMNGECSLTPGQRELLLAYAAGVCGCTFVYHAHAEVAYAHGIEPGLLEALLEDPHSAPVVPELAVLLAYVGKLSLAPDTIVQADVDAVLAAGWDEQALHAAIVISGRAALMQRLVQGLGFTPLSREVYADHARRRVERGYVQLYPQFREPS
ncbi:MULTISPECIES: carboxymuconolactone decarboxylase family protein [Pseudomonas]|uniref:carboxymuconolactone decarboxylase family protein n=1 Tax=Pseudomonas TaxID=286 RepID=UPI003817EBE7